MTDEEFKLHVVDVLGRLDTNMKGLVGNGQPGRVDKLESAVKDLEHQRWWAAGVITTLGAAAEYLGHTLFRK